MAVSPVDESRSRDLGRRSHAELHHHRNAIVGKYLVVIGGNYKPAGATSFVDLDTVDAAAILPDGSLGPSLALFFAAAHAAAEEEAAPPAPAVPDVHHAPLLVANNAEDLLVTASFVLRIECGRRSSSTEGDRSSSKLRSVDRPLTTRLLP